MLGNSRPLLKRLENKAKTFATRKYFSTLGSLKGNIIHAYWWTGRVNFGDLITPALLNHYGFTPIHSAPSCCQLLSTGSILQLAPSNYTGLVLGSGLIKDVGYPLPAAKFLVVRGKLTQERVEAPNNVVLADPGLLARKLTTAGNRKTFVLGIIPHYVDFDDPRILTLARRYPEEVKVIDVRRKASAVFNEIDRCDHILSSSLHGLITADAFGLPRAWISLSSTVIGGGFKFRDYASALEQDITPRKLSGRETLKDLLSITRKTSSLVHERQEQLENAFSSLHAYM